MTSVVEFSSSTLLSWRRLQMLTFCLVIVGLAQGEHDLDLGHLSGDDVLMPTNNKLYPAYFVPFSAVDTAKYLSSLKRHKRSVWLVPTMTTVGGSSIGTGSSQNHQISHHRGYRSHQPDYLQMTFM